MLKQMTLALTLLAAPIQAGEMMSAQDLMQTIPGATLSGISNEDLHHTLGPDLWPRRDVR